MRITGRVGILMTMMLLGVRVAACGDSDDGKAGPGSNQDADIGSDGDTSRVDGSDPIPGDEPSPPPPPSYCQGIVFYASFDQGLNAEVGTSLPARPIGAVKSATGRFGSAADLVGLLDAGANQDGGALVFYDQPDGAAPFYPAAQGTLAFWFRQVVPYRMPSAFVCPLANLDSTAPAGPAVAHQAASPGFGLFSQLGSAPLVTLTDPEMSPYLRNGEYNHYVTGWRAPVDGGAPAMALVAINGASGDVVGDAGVDAAGYDASPDDAGNVISPFFKRRVLPSWPAYGPLAAVRLGGVVSTATGGVMDDVAMWNRELSKTEIDALYRSTGSIGAVCKIP